MDRDGCNDRYQCSDLRNSFYEGSKKAVALTLDGEQKEIRTHANTIQDILEELDVSNRSEDYLYPREIQRYPII